jgi:hypothetical protein
VVIYTYVTHCAPPFAFSSILSKLYLSADRQRGALCFHCISFNDGIITEFRDDVNCLPKLPAGRQESARICGRLFYPSFNLYYFNQHSNIYQDICQVLIALPQYQE